MTKPGILIVEDNPTTRKMLKLALTSDGYDVLEAENGQQALEHMDTHVPDLILQDLMLPDMDGVELNRRLRELPQAVDIPILALSGFLSKIEEMQVSNTGFTGFIIKPVEPSHLLEVIKTYLPQTTPSPKIKGYGQHILVADDDPMQLKLLVLHLQQAGFTVSAAVDGEDALRQANADPPDAIISDVLMPNVDGFELCLQIRQDPDLVNLPILLVTSHYLEESDYELAKKVGANAYVTRTSDFQSVIDALINALKEKTLSIPSVPDQIFKDEHMHRLIRQLERQIITNVGLAQRCASQAAQLSLLRGVAEALTSRNGIDKVLQDVLAICLDAAGISKGVLYLINKQDGSVTVRQLIGYTNQEKDQLNDFFGQPELLAEIMSRRRVVQIPSNEVPHERAEDLLSYAGVSSALVVPLISVTECLGVLFLGSNVTNMVDTDVTFAHTLGTHIAQTLALAETFDRLRISEKRYRTLMDSASCGILLHDENGIILEINKQIEVMLSHSKDEIIGRDFKDFIVANERELFAAQLKKLINDKKIYSNEYHLKHDKIEINDIEIAVSYIKLGEENLFLSILNDVTERNRLRSHTLLSDKLATVGTLVTGIIHEVSNPIALTLANLNFLKEYIQTLQKNLHDLQAQAKKYNQAQDSIEFTKYLEEFNRQLNKADDLVNTSILDAEHARNIIRDLKGFAQIDDELVSTQVDVHELLDTAIKIAYPEFKHRAKIEKHFAENIPRLILNVGKLQQVFLNLIINAAQSIPEDNPQNNVIRITTRLEKKHIKIEISDTGKGIPSDILPKIFEPFFTTKPKSTGLDKGLGLAFCREVIVSMGGEIEVQSTPGTGSTFTIMLPLSTDGKPKKSKLVTDRTVKTVDTLSNSIK